MSHVWRMIVIGIVASAVACSSNNEDPAPDVGGTNSPDMPSIDMSAANDAGTDGLEDATAPTFCATADCSGETPVCSELLESCVECASSNDCATAPLLTCETLGVDGEDPAFTCVECVDDSVCAGGTCDLQTHTCM